MFRTFVRSKIHRAKVTGAELDYVGSISICKDLLKAADMAPYEFVHVNNLSNGFHWETYIIEGKKGEITLNGPPARHFRPGDLVVIFALLGVPLDKVGEFEHTVVFVDGDNNVTSVEKKS
jgi:aspartate 1-decarboxylase